MKHNVMSAFDALRPGVSYQVEEPYGYTNISIMSNAQRVGVDTSSLQFQLKLKSIIRLQN